MLCQLSKRLPKISTFTKYSRPPVNTKYTYVRCSSSAASEGRNVRGIDGDKDNFTPFAGSRRGGFFQDSPVLGNQFNRDVHLKACLKRILPKQVCIYEHLVMFVMIYFAWLINNYIRIS